MPIALNYMHLDKYLGTDEYSLKLFFELNRVIDPMTEDEIEELAKTVGVQHDLKIIEAEERRGEYGAEITRRCSIKRKLEKEYIPRKYMQGVIVQREFKNWDGSKMIMRNWN
ncbi:MAG: hypothetical protein GPJ14_24295 [Microcystis aeruginosa G11-01]|nr:hypothetical protein [Microcystis aeruginosa G11-01]